MAVALINDKRDGFLDFLLPDHELILHQASPAQGGGSTKSCAPELMQETYVRLRARS